MGKVWRFDEVKSGAHEVTNQNAQNMKTVTLIFAKLTLMISTNATG